MSYALFIDTLERRRLMDVTASIIGAPTEAMEGQTIYIELKTIPNGWEEDVPPPTIGYEFSGSAIAGVDHTGQAGTFWVGEEENEYPLIPITIRRDNLVEGDETLTIRLVAGYRSTIDPNASEITVTLRDDPPVVSVSAYDDTAKEPITHYGSTGLGDAVTEVDNGIFLFSRSGGDVAEALTINYSLSGTADNGTDYNTLSGTLTFDPGQSSKALHVEPIQDEDWTEPDETIIATVQAGPNNEVGGVPAVINLQLQPQAIAATNVEINVSGGDRKGTTEVTRTVGGRVVQATQYKLKSITPIGAAPPVNLNNVLTLVKQEAVGRKQMVEIRWDGNVPGFLAVWTYTVEIGFANAAEGNETTTFTLTIR